MVAKSIKRTPTKSIKDHRSSHRHRRKKSPIKNASAVVVASISKTFYTCHRRLIKIFSKFARIGTPKRSPRKQGYNVLKKISEKENDQRRSLCRSLFDDNCSRRLPPAKAPGRRTVFLDLDETLVHSDTIPREKYDFMVTPVIDGIQIDFYVCKRPYVDQFLEALSKKFEIVIFTAAIEEYASLVLNRIDRAGLISHRLYRKSCKEVDGKFVKDLSELGRELNSVVIVDDNPNSSVFQPENAILIEPYTGDAGDGELQRLVQFFEEGCEGFEDMRDAVKQFVEQGKNEIVEVDL